MKTQFNGASTLSKIIELTNAQNFLSDQNENLLAKLEEQFGENKNKVAMAVKAGLNAAV